MSFLTRPSKYPLVDPRNGAPIRIKGLRKTRANRSTASYGLIDGRDPPNVRSAETPIRDIDSLKEAASPTKRPCRQTRAESHVPRRQPLSTRKLPYGLQFVSDVDLPRNADDLLAESRRVKCYHDGADGRTDRIEISEVTKPDETRFQSPDENVQMDSPYFVSGIRAQAKNKSRSPERDQSIPGMVRSGSQATAPNSRRGPHPTPRLPGWSSPSGATSSSQHNSMQYRTAPATAKAMSLRSQGHPAAWTIFSVGPGSAIQGSASGNQSTLHPSKKRKVVDSDDDSDDAEESESEDEPLKKKAKGRTGRPHAPHLQYDPTKGLLSSGVAKPQVRASIPEVLTLFPEETKYNGDFLQRLVENGWNAGMVSDYINHTHGHTEADVGSFKRSTIAKRFKNLYEGMLGREWTMGNHQGTPTGNHTLAAREGKECLMADLLKDVVNLPDDQDQWDLLPCLRYAKQNPGMQFMFPSDLDQVRTLLPAESIKTPQANPAIDVDAGKRWAKKRDEMVAAKRRGGNAAA